LKIILFLTPKEKIMKRRSLAAGLTAAILLGMLLVTAYAAITGSKKEGLVEYVGA
jgi:hypothetical protein